MLTHALATFLLGTFLAAFVTGLVGFAFGMVAAAVWLHVLAPAQATAMILCYGALVQGYAVWKLRRSIVLSRLLPFVIGSAIGIPVALVVLTFVPPLYLRRGVGALLVLFGLYNLLRPRMPALKSAGVTADGAIGICNGIVGGATGLAGVVPMIWCGMRGWNRDEQRAVFQPTGLATFLMSLAAFGGVGLIAADTIQLLLIGLPALIAGTVLGWALYGKLNENTFRRIVLVLLLVSGAMLLTTGR